MIKSAVVSSDGVYRYRLRRIWDTKKEHVLFVGLNPSTADANVDDPTIRKCVGFAKRLGYGGLSMVNLFAYRATSPKDMMRSIDPVGPLNRFYLDVECALSFRIVAAWGTLGGYKDADSSFISLTSDPIYCLGLTKEGYPRHPLYVKYETEPIIYKIGERAR